MKPQKILVPILLASAIFFNNYSFAFYSHTDSESNSVKNEDNFITIPEYTIESDFNYGNNYEQDDMVVYPKVEITSEEKEITEMQEIDQKNEYSTCHTEKSLLCSKNIKLLSSIAALGILIAALLKFRG